MPADIKRLLAVVPDEIVFGRSYRQCQPSFDKRLQKENLFSVINYAREHTVFGRENYPENFLLSEVIDVLKDLPFISSEMVKAEPEHFFSDEFDSKLRNKIIVAENGLPLKNNPKSKAKVLDDRKPFKILFLSNLIESKGYFDVLQAAKILRNNHEISDFEFHFAGQFIKNVDDKTVSSVEDAQLRFELFIKDNDLSSVIKYHGVVSGNDKEKLLEQANIFVLPTNYNNEGQPVSIIEAIAHGLPIITTDYRAINDLVSDGKNGFFVEYGNAEQIAHKIALLIKDAALYSSMSQSSLDYFNEKFTMKKHLARLVPHLNGKFS